MQSPMSPNLLSPMSLNGLKPQMDTSAWAHGGQGQNLLNNPVVDAFSKFLDTLDDDEQDDLRVAIVERRLQWNLNLDEQLEKRFADLKERDDRIHEREARCLAMEEARESLLAQVEFLQCVCAHTHTRTDARALTHECICMLCLECID